MKTKHLGVCARAPETVSCIFRQWKVEPIQTKNVSPVTCYLITTLCNISCHESPRRFDDAAAEGLVIGK